MLHVPGALDPAAVVELLTKNSIAFPDPSVALCLVRIQWR
jgi:hypothetical protein